MIMPVRFKESRGFTIVELLIVIVVIGILAALTLIAYNGVTQNAVDRSVQSDADTLDGLETQYGVNNNTSGEAWYSGNGVDSNLNFTPTKGDIIDVVTNSTDYCIRIYNPGSHTYKTLATAYTKESSPGTCASTPPSSQAESVANPVVPNGGVVTTLAGSGRSGSANGTGTAATFNYPTGVAVDSSGNVYVADEHNYLIRKITPAGVVTTLAGNSSGQSNNGTGTAASFYYPQGLAVDSSGNVYVADSNNDLIRKITPAGVVTTLAGTARVSGSANGTGTSATFNSPGGVAVDSSGNVYVADTNNQLIRKITPAGVVTTLAGTGSTGFTNGTGTAASFDYPYDVAVDTSGNVYVADFYNNVIRKITPAGVVTTFAGSGSQGSTNGTATAASFVFPAGIAIDTSGNMYVADQGNNLIRKITSAGVVTTLAGSGAQGTTNGTGTAASFNDPYGIAVDSSGTVYTSDFAGNTIRAIH